MTTLEKDHDHDLESGSAHGHRRLSVVDDLPPSRTNTDSGHLGVTPGRRPRSGSRLAEIQEKVHERTEAWFGLSLVHWQTFRRRFTRGGKPHIGWMTSLWNILLYSPLNVLLIAVPFAWVSHFHGSWGHSATFALCFISIIPMESIFDWGGEQMALYLGESVGDLLVVTLNNAVEAALAIILLAHCELRLLQATIVGVIVLHLLLVPGTAFLTGGAQIWEQNLHAHHTQLNHSLLMIGVMTMLLPTAFFAALDRGASAPSSGGPGTLVSDSTRHDILRMSRGLAVLLLIVYLCSRIYIHLPPGEGGPDEEDSDELKKPAHVNPTAKTGPPAKAEKTPGDEEFKTNPWACMILLAVTVGIMATTAEFLVDSIEFVREENNIQEEWFGLILLPIVSFSADGAVAIVFYAHRIFNHLTNRGKVLPDESAKARGIDLAIQFAIFWMPFLVLLGWWLDKPMHLLFDFFELALLLGACFLVNYVTADAKTNWVEGLIMITFYFMIAICAWFYGGQPELEAMLNCPGSVAQFLASGAAGE